MVVLLVVQKINNPGLFVGFSTVVKIKAVLLEEASVSLQSHWSQFLKERPTDDQLQG